MPPGPDRLAESDRVYSGDLARKGRQSQEHAHIDPKFRPSVAVSVSISTKELARGQ
jgi:hypothetical protein